MAGYSSSTVQSLDKHAFSAPVLSVLSEEGDIILTDEDELSIDSFTGLPRLPVELLPEMADDSSKRRSVTFEPTKTQGSPSLGKEEETSSRSTSHPVAQKASSSTRLGQKADSEPPSSKTNSSPSIIRKSRGRNNPMMKTRSRSVFIKLQLPGQKTPPLPHRNLSILGESDSDTDIHTAPIVPAGEQKFFLNSDKYPRRASDFGRVSSDGKLPSPLLERAHLVDRGESSPTAPRRSSFLYGLDEEVDGDEDDIKGISRTSSMSSNHVGDETYVTPFAQVLANLHRVRAQFLMLVGLPDETKTIYSRISSGFATSPAPSPSTTKKLSDESQKRLALDTLEELDWCLKKLESVNSVKSMGIMAQDKFRRLMHRELSHMSENSRSGTQAAEWVQNITNLDDINNEKVDKALDTLYDQEATGVTNHLTMPSGGMDSRLSSSMRHDEWTKMLHNKGRKDSGGRSYCERVPLYGVSSSKMDLRKMKEFIGSQVEAWEVDTFYLDTISGGNPLVSASYHVFKARKLFAEFKISPPRFINFITEIQNAYLPNPYHNAIHASDVFLAANFLLKAKAIEEVFTNLEVLAALVAAAIHDVGHPGKSNQFLVNVRDELAILYNDNSVLENHHLALAFKIMQNPNCNFLENFEPSQRLAFRRMVIDMVLATDMAKHFKHLGELKTLLETKKVANDGILVLDKYSDRSEVLQCMLHCADLSNPAKPEAIATQWTHRVIEENFIQGDEEKSLGIPLSPLGDREQVCIGKCQVTFIDFIIYPLWETWAELVYPDAQDILENINKIREYWNARIDPNSPPPSDNAEDQQEFNSDGDNDSHLSFGDEEDEETRPEETFKLPLGISKSPLDSLPRVNVGADSSSGDNEGMKVLSGLRKVPEGILSPERGEKAKENDTKKNDNDLLQTSSDSLKKFMESPANERRSSYKNAKKTALNKGIEDDEDDSIQR